ncbi:ATP-binding cassette domain-containing protein [Aminobacter niigataensis]
MSLGFVQAWECGSFAHPRSMTQQQVQAIRVRGLEKSYELHVLRGVDFDVARGSIFALLGSNGAGKTTAANPAHSAQGGRWRAQYQRPRCRPATGERARGRSMTVTDMIRVGDEALHCRIR